MLQADARIERPTRNRHEWELHAHIATSFLIGWGGIPWEFLLGESLQVAENGRFRSPNTFAVLVCRSYWMDFNKTHRGHSWGPCPEPQVFSSRLIK